MVSALHQPAMALQIWPCVTVALTKSGKDYQLPSLKRIGLPSLLHLALNDKSKAISLSLLCILLSQYGRQTGQVNLRSLLKAHSSVFPSLGNPENIILLISMLISPSTFLPQRPGDACSSPSLLYASPPSCPSPQMASMKTARDETNFSTQCLPPKCIHQFITLCPHIAPAYYLSY